MARLVPGDLRSYAQPARMAAQTAVAALVTWGLVQATGMAEGTWAVISALFVVQQSVGGTIGTALGRLAGTALGTVIGLACVLLVGRAGWGTWGTAASLLLAVVVIDFIAGLRPGVRYGVVPAAIMILGPADDIVATALARAVAIGVGTVIGTLAGLFVFPSPAHRRTAEHLSTALRRCGDLLNAAIGSLIEAGSADTGPIHEDIRRELEAASGMAAVSRYPRWRRRATMPPPGDLLRAVERLWHTVILIDRTDTRPLPEGPLEHLGPALRDLAESSCAYLERLGHALAHRETPPSPREVRGRLGALQRALDETRRREATRSLSSGEVERVFALSFAMEELAQNFGEIAELFGQVDAPADRS